MLKLEDLKKDAQIRGLEGNKIVRIISVEPVGDDAANVFYVDPDGKPGTQMPVSYTHLTLPTTASV